MRCVLKIVCNSVKVRALQRPLWSVTAERSFYATGLSNSPRFQTRNDGPTSAKEDDVKTLEDIEKSLFDSPKYRPAAKIQTQDEPGIEPNVLRFEQKSTAASRPKKNVPAPQAADKEYRFDEKLGLKFLQMDRRDQRLR
jgi:hypothetical protein